MILPILILGDKRLREKSVELKPQEINTELRTLIDNMFETMYAAPGIGLAAVQIGVLKRLMVLDLGERDEDERITGTRNPLILINPVITNSEGSIVWEEGCLSCPDLVVPMQRKQYVSVNYLDLDAKPQVLEASDLLAVALQHEIDHMDGKLIVDGLSGVKRDLYTKQLKKNGPVVR